MAMANNGNDAGRGTAETDTLVVRVPGAPEIVKLEL